MPEPYSYNIASFEELQSLISKQPRTFSLNLVVCSDSTLRSFLVQQIEAAFNQIDSVSFWPYSDDLFEHVHEKVGEGPKDSIFIFGLDDALATDQNHDSMFRKLDHSPNRWKAWFACPVIFWINSETEKILLDEAKDFWEWQTGLFRLDPEL